MAVKVVGYDAEKQKNWLSKLGFNSSYSYVLILIIGIAGILAVYVGFYWWRQTKQQELYQRVIIQFQKQLPKHLHKRSEETFQVWMQRLSSVDSDQKSFHQVVVLYQKIVFLEQNSQQNIQEFKKLLKVCAIAIKQSQKNL
jgi:predicted PurR-regulated permease PerM